MKWLSALLSFLLVTGGVFFIAGWCLLPAQLVPASEESRLDRLRVLTALDWGRNWWGYGLGPPVGLLSGWLTIRRSR